MLTRQNLLRPAEAGPPTIRYETTGEDTEWFVRTARQMLGMGIEAVDRAPTGAIRLPKQVAHP